MNGISRYMVLIIAFRTLPLADSVDSKCRNSRGCENNKCRFRYRTRMLNCAAWYMDCIPQPSSIRSAAPPEYATSMFFSDNCLRTVRAADLQRYTCLRNLNLSKNFITTLDCSFKGLSTLKQLDLSENKISKIYEDDFSTLTNLTELNLSKNQLFQLDKNAFKNLPSLKVLDLRHNRLTTFLPGHLSGLAKLRVFMIAHNHLQTIDQHLFTSSPHLEEIDLSSNVIQCLPQNVFELMSELKSVKLMSNQLRTPHPHWVRRINQNEFLPQIKLLENNNWTCDCRAANYAEFLNEELVSDHQSKWKEALNIRCSHPKRYQGALLTDVFVSRCVEPPNVKCGQLPVLRTMRSTTTPISVTTTLRIESTTTTTTTLKTTTTTTPDIQSSNTHPQPAQEKLSRESSLIDWGSQIYPILLISILVVIVVALILGFILWRFKVKFKKRAEKPTYNRVSSATSGISSRTNSTTTATTNGDDNTQPKTVIHTSNYLVHAADEPTHIYQHRSRCHTDSGCYDGDTERENFYHAINGSNA
uniref:LRRCT domain-containing protein n=1 Tax=Ciona savignyi TaxID=51511 RepID=H2Z053_CIOSA